MKACCIRSRPLSCIVGFQNYLERRLVVSKDYVTSLKVKVTVQIYAM